MQIFLLGFGSGVSSNKQQSVSPPPKRSISPDQPNPAETITEQPSQAVGRIGWVLRTLLLSKLTNVGIFSLKLMKKSYQR